MRKITSMTMLVSIAILLINSAILYVVPEGRVAYWADWHFWGLTKTEWGDQHVTVGCLFLLATILHTYYNWAQIAAYMRSKLKTFKVFTLPFNVALLITGAVVGGTYFHVPPMSNLLQLSTALEQRGAEKYGEPPYGRAELSTLQKFAQKEMLDLTTALELLRQAGLKVEGEDEKLVVIAKKNGLTPQQVYEIIKPAQNTNRKTAPPGAKTFPSEPKPGLEK